MFNYYVRQKEVIKGDDIRVKFFSDKGDTHHLSISKNQFGKMIQILIDDENKKEDGNTFVSNGKM